MIGSMQGSGKRLHSSFSGLQVFRSITFICECGDVSSIDPSDMKTDTL